MDHKANHLDGSTVEAINRMEELLHRARAVGRRAEERLRALVGERLRGRGAAPKPGRMSPRYNAPVRMS